MSRPSRRQLASLVGRRIKTVELTTPESPWISIDLDDGRVLAVSAVESEGDVLPELEVHGRKQKVPERLSPALLDLLRDARHAIGEELSAAGSDSAEEHPALRAHGAVWDRLNNAIRRAEKLQ